jgi:hypothetical protein
MKIFLFVILLIVIFVPVLFIILMFMQLKNHIKLGFKRLKKTTGNKQDPKVNIKEILKKKIK